MVRRVFFAALVLAAAASAQVERDLAPPPWPDPAPGVGIATFSGELEMVLSSEDPLLLYVTVGNDWATTIRRINARRQSMLERYEQSEEFATLTEEEKSGMAETYRGLAVPVFELGSQADPLRELVGFRIVDGDGRQVELELRSLASDDQMAAQVILEEGEPVLLRYASAPGSLEGLPERLDIVAVLDTRGRPGMWRGAVESAPVTVRLAGEAGNETARMRRYMTGTYFLGDRQFDRARSLGEELVREDPDFIGGWLILGDARAGLELYGDALGAFQKAMDLYYAQEPPEGRPREHPEYTSRRIREVEERLARLE
jgi:hypothetical protein